MEKYLLKTINLFANWYVLYQRNITLPYKITSLPGNFEFKLLTKQDLYKFNFILPRREAGYQKVLTMRFSQARDKCLAVIDKNNGNIASYSWLRQHSFFSQEFREIFYLSKDEALLFDAFTHPLYRKKGLYKASINQHIRYLYDRKIKRVYACTVIYNEASIRALKKLGFREIRTKFSFSPGNLRNLLDFKHKFMPKSKELKSSPLREEGFL